MMNRATSFFSHWQKDIPASVVVFLVALPLCLGIALASGAPLFSGLISGIVGGLVVGALSGSPLSVSGPAAGLAVVVLGAIQSLPTFEIFLLAVVLAGVLQLAFAGLGAGVLSNFIPSAVIKGMLSAIGIILILKQIPHAVGYDKDWLGDQTFRQQDGYNTFSELFHLASESLSMGAFLISLVSLVFLFWWDSGRVNKGKWLSLVPGPLVVVLFSIVASLFYERFFSDLAIEAEHFVQVPVAATAQEFFGQFTIPDFSAIGMPIVWTTALTLALIASVETLLNIEAVDKLDPHRRISPPNRELFAQGAGNMVAGMLGGIPVTSVIVRSSANVSSGGQTKLSAISHGLLLLACVALIPSLLNLIPLSALAAILIVIGYKLASPKIFVRKYKKGWAHFIPYVVTILAILFTDLLTGVLIGLVVGAFFVIKSNFHEAIYVFTDQNNYLLKVRKDLSFLHKWELKRQLSRIPPDSHVLLDLSKVTFVDLDNAEIINDFLIVAIENNITVKIKQLPHSQYLFLDNLKPS